MLGLGVYDCLSRDIVDSETGEVYPALSCCNNAEMAARCANVNADKVIWSIKASASFNSDVAYMLREGFKSGRIRLLENEYAAEETLKELKGWGSLNPPERLMLQLPYIHTTLLIDELVKLEYEESGGRVRIYERPGARKDRYSSLAYNYYVALQIESRMSRTGSVSDGAEFFAIRRPNIKSVYGGKKVTLGYGREKHSGKFGGWS